MVLCVSLEVIHLDKCLDLLFDELWLGKERDSHTFDHLGHELIEEESLASLHNLHCCGLHFEATLSQHSFKDCFAFRLVSYFIASELAYHLGEEHYALRRVGEPWIEFD